MSGQNSTNDTMPPINGEVIPPGEAEATRAILQVVEARVREAARVNPPARRDAHPKGHGCVKAEFRVLDDLPPELRVGLFATPRKYDAWIRYSNGNPTPQADDKGDGRGMAIKLMGVVDSPSTTQDFILINHPVFAARNVADYLALETANPFWRFFLPGFNPFNFRVREALIAIAILRKKVNNLLNIRYWSMSAYLVFIIVISSFSFFWLDVGRPVGKVTRPDATRLLRAELFSSPLRTTDYRLPKTRERTRISP